MDRMSRVTLIIFGFISSLVSSVLGRDYCYVYGSAYTYCDDGYYCCENNTQCCAATISAGAIIGMVIAGLFILSICVVCAMFLVKKSQTRSGQVIRPVNNHQTVAVVNGHPHGMQMQPNYPHPYGAGGYPYGQPMQPPPYVQNAPEYSSNAQYPPPPPPQYRP